MILALVPYPDEITSSSRLQVLFSCYWECHKSVCWADVKDAKRRNGLVGNTWNMTNEGARKRLSDHLAGISRDEKTSWQVAGDLKERIVHHDNGTEPRATTKG
jgi:hypothetical protein